MSFLQSWSLLLKTREQAMLEDILNSVKRWLREQHLDEENYSDIGVEKVSSFCLELLLCLVT
jgi:proline dehydrogenase